MDKALMRLPQGGFEEIFATEIKRRFGGRPPSALQFFCPRCSQPLFPAAMGPESFQRPHFKHERDNPQAQECEYFSSRSGEASQSNRLPLPMYIRKTSQGFVVEGGFRSIRNEFLEALEASSAFLATGRKKYEVTRQRFGVGLTLIPFASLSLDPKKQMELKNAGVFTFDQLWGVPETANNAMIFTCNVDTNRGVRIRRGESVSPETDLFILIPMLNQRSIESAFPSAQHLGYVGALGTTTLQVFVVRFSSKEPKFEAASQFIRNCGMDIGEPVGTLALLWPPSLRNGDLIQPLLDSPKVVFSVSGTESAPKSVFIHDDLNAFANKTEVRTTALGDVSARVAAFDTPSTLELISICEDQLSDSVLVTPAEPGQLRELATYELEPKVSETSTSFEISLRRPCVLKEIGAPDKRLADQVPANHLIAKGKAKHPRIIGKLLDSRSRFRIYWEHFAKKALADAGKRRKSKREEMLVMNQPDGLKAAKARRDGAVSELQTRGKRLALIRRSNNA